ncbi:MAG: hypothetical protein MJ252_02505, partial [archaeon]|nr:hypothetical protein [archaeon]
MSYSFRRSFAPTHRLEFNSNISDRGYLQTEPSYSKTYLSTERSAFNSSSYRNVTNNDIIINEIRTLRNELKGSIMQIRNEMNQKLLNLGSVSNIDEVEDLRKDFFHKTDDLSEEIQELMNKFREVKVGFANLKERDNDYRNEYIQNKRTNNDFKALKELVENISIRTDEMEKMLKFAVTKRLDAMDELIKQNSKKAEEENKNSIEKLEDKYKTEIKKVKEELESNEEKMDKIRKDNDYLKDRLDDNKNMKNFSDDLQRVEKQMKDLKEDSENQYKMMEKKILNNTEQTIEEKIRKVKNDILYDFKPEEKIESILTEKLKKFKEDILDECKSGKIAQNIKGWIKESKTECIKECKLNQSTIDQIERIDKIENDLAGLKGDIEANKTSLDNELKGLNIKV